MWPSTRAPPSSRPAPRRWRRSARSASSSSRSLPPRDASASSTASGPRATPTSTARCRASPRPSCAASSIAESDSLLGLLQAQPDGAGRRPPAVEAVGIATTAAIAKEASAPIHIAHVSSRTALDAVRAGLELGADLTAETCPQYLLLDDRTVERFGGLAKIAPPLRTPEDRDALWAAIEAGTIGVVASDHSPFLPHEKLDVDFEVAPQGLPTVELLVPAILDAAARGVLPVERAVGLVTAAPARLFGLETKGTLDVGADADVTLFSFTEPTHPDADAFTTRARGCAVVFEPLELRARIAETLVAGNVVFANGRIIGEPRGRFLAGARVTVREPEPV